MNKLAINLMLVIIIISCNKNTSSDYLKVEKPQKLDSVKNNIYRNSKKEIDSSQVFLKNKDSLFFSMTKEDRNVFIKKNKSKISNIFLETYLNEMLFKNNDFFHDLLDVSEKHIDDSLGGFYLYVIGSSSVSIKFVKTLESASLRERINEYFLEVFFENPNLFYSFLEFTKKENQTLNQILKSSVNDYLDLRSDYDSNIKVYVDSIKKSHYRFAKEYIIGDDFPLMPLE